MKHDFCKGCGEGFVPDDLYEGLCVGCYDTQIERQDALGGGRLKANGATRLPEPSHTGRKRRGAAVSCTGCGRRFYRRPYFLRRIRTGPFCSPECRNQDPNWRRLVGERTWAKRQVAT